MGGIVLAVVAFQEGFDLTRYLAVSGIIAACVFSWGLAVLTNPVFRRVSASWSAPSAAVTALPESTPDCSVVML